MEDILTRLALNIDKSSWEPVKFGDVSFEPKETCKDILKEGIEHVVGLEHITTGDIRLRNSATIEDSTTFSKKFQTGDVLFGRRRAYLKKAAQASFGGICSGDITVFRAKKNLLPALLPFIVSNDKFFDYAIKHSAGGLSPRVKFKDLANYQFLLPPKEEQAQLAELLWAMDEVIEKERMLFEQLEINFKSQIENKIHGFNMFGKTINKVLVEISKPSELESLECVGELLKGKGIPKSDVQKSGVPCIRYGELYTKHDRIVRHFNSFIDPDLRDSAFKLMKHDVLFAGSGETITEIGKSAAFVSDFEAYAGGDILVLRPYNMDGHYLGYLMNSQLVRQQLNKYGTGATVMHIYNSDLKKIKIPKRSREIQELIGRELETISENLDKVKEIVVNSKALQKSLINQIF